MLHAVRPLADSNDDWTWVQFRSPPNIFHNYRTLRRPAHVQKELKGIKIFLTLATLNKMGLIGKNDDLNDQISTASFEIKNRDDVSCNLAATLQLVGLFKLPSKRKFERVKKFLCDLFENCFQFFFLHLSRFF